MIAERQEVEQALALKIKERDELRRQARDKQDEINTLRAQLRLFQSPRIVVEKPRCSQQIQGHFGDIFQCRFPAIFGDRCGLHQGREGVLVRKPQWKRERQPE